MASKLTSLTRSSRKKNTKSITEDQLRAKARTSPISVDDVLALSTATEQFLIPLDRNIYEIEFTRFILRNMETNQVMIDIGKPTEEPEQKPADIGDASRFVRYNLRKDILKLKTIGATVEFKVSELEKLLTKVQVGSRPIKNFSMVERHFFRNKLLKSFIFEFGFVIPDSINNAEHIYEVPKLDKKLLDQIEQNPYETRSDSFYFVDGELIMHHRADYSYRLP